MFKIDSKKAVLYLFLIMIASYTIGFSLLQNNGLFPFNLIFAGDNSKNFDESKNSELTGVEKIKISTDSTDIRFLPANDQKLTAHLHGSHTYNKKELPIKFLVKTKGNTLDVQVKHLKHLGFYHSRLQLDIYLPENYQNSLQISTASGDCDINTIKDLSQFDFSTSSGDFNGNLISAKTIQLSSASGDLELNGVCDTFSLHTASGEFKSNSLQAGSAVMDTASGNFRIEGNFKEFRFKSASGDLYAKSFQSETTQVNTVSGRITLKGVPGNIEAVTMSGDINIDYSVFNFNINAHTMSGNINIKVPENSDFSLSFKSASGNLRLADEFPMTIKESGSKHHFEGSIRESKNKIVLNTTSGDAKISD